MKILYSVFIGIFLVLLAKGDDKENLRALFENIEIKSNEDRKKEIYNALKKFEKKFSKLSNMEIKDKLIDIKIQNLFQERIIDEKKAELLLTIALVKNYNKGVKINIASILNCSSNFELGVKEMALHDIKNAHFNYLCIGNTLIQDTHPDFAKLMKEKFNLILIRAHYSYKVPNYLFKLCNIYNTIVIEELGKKYGKDFFGKTTDKFLEEKKL